MMARRHRPKTPETVPKCTTGRNGTRCRHTRSPPARKTQSPTRKAARGTSGKKGILMKVTALLENTTASPACRARHGLSLYVETARHKILFDLGPDGTFADNAARLGVDLRAVDTVILSHGHRDHGGGLARFLAENDTAKIYLRPAAADPHYIRVCGIPFSVTIDASLVTGDRFVFTDDVTVIDEELTVFSDVGHSSPLPASDRKLWRRQDGKLTPDDFGHEQSLLLTEGGKTTLFCGCSHAGIVNITRRAAELAGGTVDTVIGGFHLYNPPTRRYETAAYIDAVAQALAGGDSTFYTCHCTGARAVRRMRSTLGDRLRTLSTGATLTLC